MFDSSATNVIFIKILFARKNTHDVYHFSGRKSTRLKGQFRRRLRPKNPPVDTAPAFCSSHVYDGTKTSFHETTHCVKLQRTLDSTANLNTSIFSSVLSLMELQAFHGSAPKSFPHILQGDPDDIKGLKAPIRPVTYTCKSAMLKILRNLF